MVPGFWGKRVPAFLSKIRNRNLTRKSSAGSGNPPARQEEMYRYMYRRCIDICTHRYGQSCEVSLHRPCTPWSVPGLGWPLTTEGCKRHSVTPPSCWSHVLQLPKATSGTARGGGLGFAVPVGGHSSRWQDQALLGHWARSTLRVGRNCSALASKAARYSKK